MSTCNTCGNNTSLPCGCKDIALNMSCADYIGLNCSTDANQCASIECAECVVSCGQEDMWAAIGPTGENYIYQNGWSMLQYQQSTAVINAVGVAALMNGYFTLFTCPTVTSSTVQLQWSFLASTSTVLPTAFQLEYREITDPASDWTIVATIPYGQTSFTVSASNTLLTPGLQYQFRIKSVDAAGVANALEFQSVWLNITIPN
tara:strand:+ start:2476 stop:3084 length:609 start_codon:yes stop_codon:yes gene_type:complete